MLCIEKDPKMYMKARCSLLILNRMASVYPNSYMIAHSIQTKQLQKLVDAKDEISQDLYTLAGRCNENLKKKIATFPEAARIAREDALAKENLEKEKAQQEAGAKAKIKAEEKRKEAEMASSKHVASSTVVKEEKQDLALGSKRNVTQTHGSEE